MSVHGIQPGKGKNQETGDWAVKTVLGKTVLDSKRKPLVGMGYAAARDAARGHLSRTGEYVVPVRG